MDQIGTQSAARLTIHPGALRQRAWLHWSLLALYSAFLLAVTCDIAAHRHLWFDEIDTFFVGTLPSFHKIWQILLLGADGQPLGFYIPVHLSYLFAGSSPLAIRLCAVIPFWLTTLVLYYAVSRRTAPVYGFVAALAPTFTIAFQYSFEARPYALVLFFSACSFVAWQFAKEQRMRALSVPALGFALAAAVYVHYNAILVVVPILIGELAFTLRKRVIDWPILLAACAIAVPLLISRPHIHAIHAYSKIYWSHITFNELFDIYFVLATKFIVLAILCCALFGFLAALSARTLRHIQVDFQTLPPHELAAAAGYLLLPLCLFVLSIYTKALHYRYAIATVIGLSLFIPFALWLFRSVLSKTPQVLCALLVLSLLYTAAGRLRAPDEESWGTYANCAELFNPQTKAIYDTPQALVLGDGPFFLAAKYGNLALRDKSFYLISNNHASNNSPMLFKAFKGVVPEPFHLADFIQFKKTHPSFLIYDPEPWLLQQLFVEGASISVKANLPHGFLYEVALNPSDSSTVRP